MFIENLCCLVIIALTAFAVFYFFVNIVFDCDFGWYTTIANAFEKVWHKMRKRG